MKALLALTLVLVARLAAAGTECVWVPIEVPFEEPDPEGLVIYGNGEVIERKDWWRAEGRAAFWVCGERTAVLQAAIVRGGIESAKSGTLPPDPTATETPAGPFLLGAYYGPYEQLRRQIDRVFASTDGTDFIPVDVNQNGAIEPMDQKLLQMTMQGEFGKPMPYSQMCLESTPVPCP